MNKPSARGRRPGPSDTRERILAVAREQFLAGGYHEVTLRSIAAEAGVDVALVGYHFGSKRGLFVATMALPVNPAAIIGEEIERDEPDTLARRVLTRLVEIWDDPESGGRLIALAELALGDPAVKRLLAEALAREMVEPIAAATKGRDAEARAAAFCTLVSGVIFSRYLLAVEPIASMEPGEVVRRCAPGIQAALDGRR